MLMQNVYYISFFILSRTKIDDWYFVIRIERGEMDSKMQWVLVKQKTVVVL